MGPNRQIEDLCALYAEKTDGELLDLHEQRDDLTDTAQEALSQVMRERKLSAPVAPKFIAAQVVDVEQNAALGSDEAVLWTFDDAFQANEALRILTTAEVPHRVLDSSKKLGNAFRGSTFQLQLSVVLQRKDVRQARGILQDAMGLFPGPESDGGADEPDAPDGMSLFSMFELKDALVAAQVLGQAGISYLWRDGRDATQQLPDEDTVAIEVHPDQLERATKLVEDKLG